jgi:spore maturation protein CgeB
MIELLGRSKIALNFSSSQGNKQLKFLKGRVFEIPATGAMLLTQQCEHLDDYFTIGKEVEVFSDKAEMLMKIEAYLSDEAKRNDVAQAGKSRVLLHYTMEHALHSVL